MSKPASNNIKSNIKSRTWSETLEALGSTHTTSIKDACRALKVSRSFATKYIVPECDRIYLSSGRRGNELCGKNWLLLADSLAILSDPTASTWLNTEKFYELFMKSITDCSVQTINVPFARFIKPSEYSSFVREYDSLRETRNDLAKEQFKSAGVSHYFKDIKRLDNEMEDLLLFYAEEDTATQALLKMGKVDYAKRSATARCRYPLPSFADCADFKKFMLTDNGAWSDGMHTLSSLKGYGDIDEQIYRELFKRGYVRIEVAFGSGASPVTGNAGRIVYYTKPYVDEPLGVADSPHHMRLCSYEAWERYKRYKRI